MKNIQSLLIVTLLFLLLSSLGGIYFIKQKYDDAKRDSMQNVEIFVSDKNISVNHLILASDIKQIKLPKSAVNFRILTQQEIIGKYTKSIMYQNEPFIPEKLAVKTQNFSDSNLTSVNDKFNMRFSLFQNPNFNLKKGDRIDIIGVYKDSKDQTSNNYQVDYSAKNIKVLDFLRSGISQTTPVTKTEIPTDNQKDKNLPRFIFAEELILDMNSAEITKTLALMNKNNQIWMVLSGENRNGEAIKKIQNIVNNGTNTVSMYKKQDYNSAPSITYESTTKTSAQ